MAVFAWFMTDDVKTGIWKRVIDKSMVYSQCLREGRPEAAAFPTDSSENGNSDTWRQRYIHSHITDEPPTRAF